MKTKDLIALLQQEDPTGEEEVVLPNGDDIHFLESLPGYWDGCYTTLIRDPSKTDCYNIIGAKYCSNGNKIKIRGMSWEDVVANKVDAPVEVIDTFVYKRMQKEVDDWREEMKKMYEELNKQKNGKNLNS